jgi:WD40 repeat protein
MPRTVSRMYAALLAVALPLATIGFVDLPAHAADGSVTVTRFDDPAGSGDCVAGGDCSLRQALAEASSTVTLPAGTYTLTRGELVAARNGLEVDGAGADTTVVEQTTPDARVFRFDASGQLQGLTVRGGHSTSYGGGVGVSGTFALTLIGVRVTGNTAATTGGGVGSTSTGVAVSAVASTIDTNTAGTGGGGIALGPSGSPQLTNTTVAGNTTTGGAGGGLLLASRSYAYLTFTTVARNSAPQADAIAFDPGVDGNLDLRASALGGTCGRSDGSVTALPITSLESTVDDATCPLSDSRSDLVPDLGLSALGDHGGPTPTLLPQPGSPLIDAVSTDLAGYLSVSGAVAGPTDQRGRYRPGGALFDAGSVEVHTDTSDPTWPAAAALTATGVTYRSVTLHWPAASDDTGVYLYRITGGPTVVDVAGDATSTRITDLAPSTDYTFSIRALDRASNATPPRSVVVSTQAVPPPLFTVSRITTLTGLTGADGDLSRLLADHALVATATGEERTVTGVPAVISADGETVASVTGSASAPGGPTYTITVQRGFDADLTGGTSSALTVPGTDYLHRIALADDGSMLAVVFGTGGGSDDPETLTLIALTGANAGQRYSVPLGSGPGRTSLLRFSPDGHRLLRVAEASVWGVVSARVWDISDPAAPTATDVLQSHTDGAGTIGDGDVFGPVTISRDFSTFAFVEAYSTGGDPKGRLVASDLDGSHRRILLEDRALETEGWLAGSIRNLSLDADGSRVAYTTTEQLHGVKSVVGYVLDTTGEAEPALVAPDAGEGPQPISGPLVLADSGRSVVFEAASGAVLSGGDDGQADGLFLGSAEAPDVLPPTWPGGAALTAGDIGATTITLHWPAATDDRSLAGYTITGGPVRLSAPASATSIEVGDLDPGSTYAFSVTARDRSGNTSTPLSASVTTLTSATPGTAKLTATARADGSVALAWDAASGVTGYQVERARGSGAFAVLGTTGSGTRAFTDLAADAVTTYRYRVRKIVAGAPQDHTAFATVTTGAVTVTSVMADVPMSGPQAAYGGLVTLTVRGQAHRAGVGSLTVATPTGQATVAAELSEDAGVAGRYTATMAIPTGATALVEVGATLRDSAGPGAGTGHSATTTKAYPLAVGARVVVTIPSAVGFTGVASVASDRTGIVVQRQITSTPSVLTLTFDVPSGEGYRLRVIRGGVTPMLDRSVPTLADGAKVEVELRSLDLASLTLHLGSGGGAREVKVTGAGTTGLASGTTDNAGNVTIPGLWRGSPVLVTVQARTDDWALTLPEAREVALDSAQTEATLPVTTPAAASVSGVLTTSDGSALAGVTVSAIQTWRGQSRTAWAKIANDGTFAVTGLLAGLPTTLTGAGVVYGTATNDLTPTAGVNHAALTLTPTGEYEVHYSVATKLGSDAAQPQALDWRTLVHLRAAMTPGPGVAFSNSVVYGGGEITARGEAGSPITFCADGVEGGYGAGCVTATLPDRSVSTVVHLPLTLTSAGRLRVTVNGAGSGVEVVGSLRGSEATVSSWLDTATSATLALPAEGTWDLVATDADGRAGRTSIDSAVATEATIALAAPPSGFPAADNELVTAQESVQPGGTLDLTARWHATRTVAGASTVQLVLPQGTTVPAHGVTVNGAEPATSPTVEDRILTIAVPAVTAGTSGRATVRLAVAGAAAPVPATGVLGTSADLVIGTLRVPLGTVRVDVAAVTISAPEITGARSIRVRGKAAAGATVTVLDGATPIGTAVAGAGGSWTTVVALPDFGQGAVHGLAATASAGAGGAVAASSPVQVAYDRYHPTLVSGSVSQQERSASGEAGSSFPLVVVPGSSLDVEAAFADASMVSNPTLSVGDRSLPAQVSSSGKVFASFGSITPRGPVTIDYDATEPVTVPLAQVAGATPTSNDVRASLGTLGSLFGTPTLGAVDNSASGSAVVNVPVPGLGSSAAARMTVTKTPVTGLPAGARKVAPGVWVGTSGLATSASGFTVSGTTYVDTVAASAATGVAALAAPAARIAPAAPAAAATVVRVGYEIAFTGVTSLDDTLDAIGAGDKYKKLAALLDAADDCAGSAGSQFHDRIDQIAHRAAADDATKAAMMLAGVLLGPETFGIGTLAMWAASTAMEKLLDDSLQEMIDDVVHDINASPECPHEKTTHHHEKVVDPQWIYDPSGAVYDGPTTSPLTGATVTLLRAASADGTYDLWDADAYAQGPNPATTAADGRYGWNVPEGWYKVVASKGGHLSDASVPLEVLPPRTGVDLVLPPEQAVTATAATGRSDGSVIVSFSSWVDAGLVNRSQITVTDVSGKALAAVVAPLAPASGVDGRRLTKQARITVPGLDRRRGQTVKVRVDGALQDVAGRPLAATAQLSATVPAVTVPPPVKVRVQLRLAKPTGAAAKRIKVRKRLVLRGTATRVAQGAHVVLQRQVRHRWKTIAVAVVPSTGRLRFSITPRTRGVWKLRLSGGASTRTTANVSPTVRLRVR